jgi:hypothetical protein
MGIARVRRRKIAVNIVLFREECPACRGCVSSCVFLPSVALPGLCTLVCEQQGREAGDFSRLSTCSIRADGGVPQCSQQECVGASDRVSFDTFS